MLLDILLLVLGFIFLVRLVLLVRRKPERYPRCNPQEIEKWLRADRRAMIVGVVASWGMLIIRTVVLIMWSNSAPADEPRSTLKPELVTSAFALGALTVAAVLGMRAQTLRTQALLSERSKEPQQEEPQEEEGVDKQ